MPAKRIETIESRVEQLETALMHAFSLITQLDVVHFAVGETLLAKNIYTKDEVSVHIEAEVARRMAVAAPVKPAEPTIIPEPLRDAEVLIPVVVQKACGPYQ